MQTEDEEPGCKSLDLLKILKDMNSQKHLGKERTLKTQISEEDRKKTKGA